MRIRTLMFIGMVVGCADQPRTPTGASELDAVEYHAARQMAEARCDRHTGSCNPQPNRQACVDSKVLESATDANLRECNGRVDETMLSACLSEIRRTPCGSGIRNLEDCNDEQLCTFVEEGTL